ncbi:hypothetical protein SynBIOSU31_01995 [Synechococcus sp. BIOS-U3-1]|nr:hypothetical protein SynBIOSU31_01995 [Synechococcus sp. BIOS-U3-1]
MIKGFCPGGQPADCCSFAEELKKSAEITPDALGCAFGWCAGMP